MAKFEPWSFVSVADLAGELGLSKQKVRGLCADGTFEFIEVGRKWMVDRASVAQWIALKKARANRKMAHKAT